MNASQLLRYVPSSLLAFNRYMNSLTNGTEGTRAVQKGLQKSFYYVEFFVFQLFQVLHSNFR